VEPDFQLIVGQLVTQEANDKRQNDRCSPWSR